MIEPKLVERQLRTFPGGNELAAIACNTHPAER